MALTDLNQATMSISQAARILGLSGSRIRQLIDDDRIRIISSPLGRLVLADSVEELRVQRLAKASAR